MILYTSDTDTNKKLFKTGFVYLIASLFCALFGAIYEHYSHEVYSYFMIYSFAFPLVLGALPSFILCTVKSFKSPDRLSANLYNSGISTLTVGSIVRGILDIYGTTNNLVYVYLIAGVTLTLSGILIFP